LDAEPTALHRLPESIAHVAVALWVQALEEGRRRAAIEQNKPERAKPRSEDRLAPRSHFLSSRGEQGSRLQDREHLVSELSQKMRSLELQVKRRDAEIIELTQHIVQIGKPAAQRRQPNGHLPAKRLSKGGRRVQKQTQVTRAEAQWSFAESGLLTGSRSTSGRNSY